MEKNTSEALQCLKLAVARLELAHKTGETDILKAHIERFKDALKAAGVEPAIVNI